MSGVWMSGLLNNYQIGMKQGTRTKFFGHEWQPATHDLGVPPDPVMEGIKQQGKGFAVRRDQMPEAAAVWDEKCFKRSRALLAEAGFFVVRGKLAETLARFDLGEGRLVPFPIYQADLVTPHGDDFYLLNFGARKNTIVIDQCDDARKFYVDKDTKLQVWHINNLNEDGPVAVSETALDGPDLWFEQAVHDKIFMSGALASALQEARLAEDWKLQPCRIVPM